MKRDLSKDRGIEGNVLMTECIKGNEMWKRSCSVLLISICSAKRPTTSNVPSFLCGRVSTTFQTHFLSNMPVRQQQLPAYYKELHNMHINYSWVANP